MTRAKGKRPAVARRCSFCDGVRLVGEGGILHAPWCTAGTPPAPEVTPGALYTLHKTRAQVVRVCPCGCDRVHLRIVSEGGGAISVPVAVLGREWRRET